MSALHASPLQVHGHLRSSKCLIDSRWVCKVSDYGLHLLKSGQKPEDVGEYTEYQSKLRGLNSSNNQLTQKNCSCTLSQMCIKFVKRQNF